MKATGAPLFDPVKATMLLDAVPLATVDLPETGKAGDPEAVDGLGKPVDGLEGEPEVTVTITVMGEHDGQVGHAFPLALGKGGFPLVGTAVRDEVRAR